MSKNKKSAKKENKIAGKIVAAIIAIALILASGLAITYLINRGKNAIQNYSNNQSTVIKQETPTGHTVEEKDMPKLEADDGKSEGYIDGAIYIWNNKGFEVFKGTVTDAKSYAKSINSYQRALGDKCKIYNVVVPSSTEISLPERLSKTFSNNQRENINTIITNLSVDVTPIDVYNILGEKRNEQLYYNTEKYWTPLGAYYGYTEIAKNMGINSTKLEDFSPIECQQQFLGSYISATVSKETKDGNPKLISNPDKVKYYSLPETVSVKSLKPDSDTLTEMEYFNNSVADNASPCDIYNTTDCSYTVLTNSALDNDKIAIVTDKCGYAVAPFLSSNFSQVHIIDIDNFQRNIKDYIEENKITNVIYLNGITSANTAVKTAKMDAMF